jgi:hypothetical protein
MARYLGTTNTAQITAGGGFTGGNQSSDTLMAFMQLLAGRVGSARAAYSVMDVYRNIQNSVWSVAYFAPAPSATSPTSGGTMTVNSQSVASYDYTVKVGNQTISSFTNSDWFTGTEDTRSALIYVSGNLTIDGGQTVIPSNRKLFTAIYVNGNLTINGAISMSSMGSNHNGTGNSGGSVTAVAIRLANGTYSGVSNPEIPSAGGAGGASSTGVGNPGTAGTSGGTGGGGGGGGNGGASGTGATGTAFVGGSGGGGTRGSPSSPGTANGGAGGDGATDGLGSGGGGAGQPGGAPAQSGPFPAGPGDTGIGGVIVIYCTGTFSGSGSISASGTNGGGAWNGAGGGSGGGSVTVFYGSDTSSISPTATGGSGGASNAGGAPGGNGGGGTARKLSF